MNPVLDWFITGIIWFFIFCSVVNSLMTIIQIMIQMYYLNEMIEVELQKGMYESKS